jgi:serralysin
MSIRRWHRGPRARSARLGGRSSNTDVVNLLYTNVVGSAPSAETLAYYKDLLDRGSFTQGSLGVLAADTSINTTNINLMGLAMTGVEFV